MKRGKIVLFTLLLSIVGVIDSINAASVNNSNRSADLMTSQVSQLIQDSSLIKVNIENPESRKCILWSPRIKNFKKGDQIKILLPHGKYMGKSIPVKIVSHGREIAMLKLEYGSDYGTIIFMINVSGSEFSQIIAGFGNMDFGEIGTSCINGSCTENAGDTVSKVPITSVAGFSSLLSNRDDDNIGSSSADIQLSSIKASSSLLSSKSNESSRPSSSSHHGKENVIDYGSGPVSIIPSSSERSLSKSSNQSKNLLVSKSSFSVRGSSSNLLNSSSIKKLSISNNSATASSLVSSQSLNARRSKTGYPSVSKSSSVLSSQSNSCISSIYKSSKSSIREKKSYSHKSVIIAVPVIEPVNSVSDSISLNHSSSTLKIPAKINHFSRKEKPVKLGIHRNIGINAKAGFHMFGKRNVLIKQQTIQNSVRETTRLVVSQNGSSYLNSQQIRALKRKMYFSNSKAINAVKEMDNAADFHVTHYVSAITSSNSKQKLMMKPQNVTHSDSNVRRVTLPIRGILPATRMDSHTWIYSLVGLAIMIISGKAFFSKKQK